MSTTTPASPFVTVDDLLAFAAAADPADLRIEPHHSASYLWQVICPAVFGRLAYGFSSTENLLAWANAAFAGENTSPVRSRLTCRHSPGLQRPC